MFPILFNKYLLRIRSQPGTALVATDIVSPKDGCISHEELGYAAITNAPPKSLWVKTKKICPLCYILLVI